jgi:hypothetical protein
VTYIVGALPDFHLMTEEIRPSPLDGNAAVRIHDASTVSQLNLSVHGEIIL